MVAETDVNLEFLGNQTGLINDSRVFAFFCCKVIVGPNLSWEIRGEGIGVFVIDNKLDRVIARNQLDYGYIATVLSRRENNSSDYFYSSVLMVLVPKGSSVEVSCVSNGDRANISNLDTPHLGQEINGEPRGNNFLLMLPVITNLTIMGVPTWAFICASTGQDQSWTTDMYDHIRFDSNSNFGSHHSKSSRNSLRLQAIFLGQHHQYLISILYLTDNAVSRVRCSANSNMVEYPGDFKTLPGVQWCGRSVGY